MKTFIVLIPVEDNTNARKSCEYIENRVYTVDKVTPGQVYKEIEKDLEGRGVPVGIEVWNISDFMELVNNEEFNDTLYFLSYVYGEEKLDNKNK